jgi:hypothetical protein
MIKVCPNCGQMLQSELKDGIAFCSHCNQIFDSSLYNRLLSCFWQIKKYHLSFEKLKCEVNLDQDFLILVYTYVAEYEYSYDEFVKFLKKLGISKKIHE